MSKTVTDRQFAASRANAQKSTGPRTEAGKLRSSRNALSHALTAFSVPLAGPDRALFRDLEREIYSRVSPISAAEDSLVRRLVAAHFNLRQAERILQGFYDLTDFPDLPAPKRVTERHRFRRLASAMLDGSNATRLLQLVLRYQCSARREIAAVEKQLETLRAPERETKPLEQAMQYAAMHLGRQGLYRLIRSEARKLAPVFSPAPRPPKPPLSKSESSARI
jgi:hypothetical protein